MSEAVSSSRKATRITVASHPASGRRPGLRCRPRAPRLLCRPGGQRRRPALLLAWWPAGRPRASTDRLTPLSSMMPAGSGRLRRSTGPVGGRRIEAEREPGAAFAADSSRSRSMKKMSPRSRVVAGAVAVAALAAGTLGAVSASAETNQAPAAVRADVSDRNLAESTGLTVEAATRAAQAALDAAQKNGQHVSVAVVDRNGVTRVLLKGDGAGPQSPELGRAQGVHRGVLERVILPSGRGASPPRRT